MSDVLREEPVLDVDTLRQAIQEEYAEVASHPEKGFHFHTGRPLARMLEYADEWLEGIPESSIESFAGTGNPFSLGELHPGERVVDVGCGAGIDSLVAAKKVGPDGQVIGVDMTPSMLEKARRAAKEARLESVEFREGYAEALPVDDGWADVVISNGVLNLMPDKDAALGEISRVLKPRGRLQIGDILVQKALPESAKRKIDLWTGWIAGALLEAELEATVVAAGFVGFEITWRKDVFSDAPQAGSAEKFGTLGINFRARKAGNEEEWAAAMAALSCEVPTQRSADAPAEKLKEKPKGRPGHSASAVLLPFIHPTSGKESSPMFDEKIRKIAHMGDTLCPDRQYDAYVTQGDKEATSCRQK